MTEVLQNLVRLLEMKALGDDRFLGDTEDLGFRNVFGGQVLGQSLMAAYKTVGTDRRAHSMHAYFLRPGKHAEPIEYAVTRVRDGSSFSTRRVVAIQDGREIYEMSASFQLVEEGLDHQFDMPDTKAPETLMSELEIRRKFQHLIPEKVRDHFTSDRPIEIRPVKPTNYLKPDIRPPFKQNWFRAIDRLPDDPAIHQCVFAYSSDFGLLGTSMNPHGVTFMQKGMQVASLDHAIWFHRDFRVDDWLLYDMDSPSASGGRGLNRGNVFTQEGVLAASVTQEALIRKRQPKSV